MNHINSISRKKLNEKTPFELAELLISPKLLTALSFEKIAPDDVHLTEELADEDHIKKTLLEILY